MEQQKDLGSETKKPDWWHDRGYEMEIKDFDQEKERILIVGMAAQLQITYRTAPSGSGWLVDWEISHPPNAFNGRVLLTSEELGEAFGLSKSSGISDDWLMGFGAEAARQGKYIRLKKFLNIPCPGTGHNGDPNISIFLDGKIQDAIKQLIIH